MTKEDLIKYSAKEVRQSAHLYTEFLNIYREEYGRGCASCQFKSVFAAWQSQQTPKNITMSANTFILKEPNARFRVNETEILSSKASDEIALKWLALKSYGGNPTKTENLEKVFKVLPDGYNDLSSDFSKMKKADLQTIATDNEYPEAEWKLLNVEPLREYLSAKATEIVPENIPEIVDEIIDPEITNDLENDVIIDDVDSNEKV